MKNFFVLIICLVALGCGGDFDAEDARRNMCNTDHVPIESNFAIPESATSGAWAASTGNGSEQIVCQQTTGAWGTVYSIHITGLRAGDIVQIYGSGEVSNRRIPSIMVVTRLLVKPDIEASEAVGTNVLKSQHHWPFSNYGLWTVPEGISQVEIVQELRSEVIVGFGRIESLRIEKDYGQLSVLIIRSGL